MGTKVLNILNIKRDNLGRILAFVFVFINIYNANNETEQLHTLNDLINLCGHFNVILKPTLDSEGGKPVIKKKTIAKLI